ncbi:MAG: starch-binding protein [Prevotella sp.]|nr:starch-binding protein [Prevotella sp.]
MKRTLLLFSLFQLLTTGAWSQGWPSQYGGVMLQAFYWDSFNDTQWALLESQADELAGTFDLVWLPQSGNCGGQSMGYDDLYWFNNYNSSFGNEQQLRSLINTFKAKGIKTIADVVINHRQNLSNWVDFPKETYKGETYEMKSTDIVRGDDGGACLQWASKNGYELSANYDTGEDWGGMRDLDHKSENVQKCVKAYLDFLKNDLGYAGFRYDMVKGYSASYTGQYNVSSQPEFSVGECWDSSNTIKGWIEGTKVDGTIQSAAFDFQFKYVVRNATDKRDWTWLGKTNDDNGTGTNWPLMSGSLDQGKYRRYAVTFVENHDTEVRPDGSSNGPLRRDTLAANAFMLAMPGTPCVFMKHWQKYPTEIKAMVAARKAAGIHSESNTLNFRSNKDYYAIITRNDNEYRLLTVVGNVSAVEANLNTKQWAKIHEGYHYAYFFPTAMNTAYVDLATGLYDGEQKARLTAVTDEEGAQLVYTTDGSDPTASSTKVASGQTITIPVGTTMLKVAMLVGGAVSGMTTRAYIVRETGNTEVVIPDFCQYSKDEVCAFFEAPRTWGLAIKCWAWDTNANNVNYTGGNWPGAECKNMGKAPNGNNVWKWTFNEKDFQGAAGQAKMPSHIIFSSNGAPQTKDMPFHNAGYYTEEGYFATVESSIDGILADEPAYSKVIYTLDGRRVENVTRPGLYIKNMKIVVIK